MCCGVVPILFGWFLRIPSLHALVFIQKTFFVTFIIIGRELGCTHLYTLIINSLSYVHIINQFQTSVMFHYEVCLFQWPMHQIDGTWLIREISIEELHGPNQVITGELHDGKNCITVIKLCSSKHNNLLSQFLVTVAMYMTDACTCSTI